MKVKRLKCRNLGILKDVDIEINQPMLIFYGKIQQGKSTILNAIRWLAGGRAINIPKNLIQEGKTEASIELELENGKIYREFYYNKAGELSAKKLEAVINNEILTQEEVTKLFNPFLIDQNHFTKKNSTDKTKFLLEVFGVNTSVLDSEYKTGENKAKDLRIKLKMYGEIDLTEYEKVDVFLLKNQKENKINEYKKLEIDRGIKCDKIDTKNSQINSHNTNIVKIEAGIEEKKNQILKLQEEINKRKEWLQENTRKAILKYPEQNEYPNTAELDTQISEANVKNIRAEQYQTNLIKQKEKQADKKMLSEITDKQKVIKKQKTEKLQVISGKIKGLEFDEVGNFKYLNTASDMLSDSQQMELSTKLSSLYPDGLKIELIDRGESLGKSVFKLIDEAKEKERNILVSIVGDKPAKIPENIGVFVVEKGNVTAK